MITIMRWWWWWIMEKKNKRKKESKKGKCKEKMSKICWDMEGRIKKIISMDKRIINNYIVNRSLWMIIYINNNNSKIEVTIYKKWMIISSLKINSKNKWTNNIKIIKKTMKTMEMRIRNTKRIFMLRVTEMKNIMKLFNRMVFIIPKIK